MTFSPRLIRCGCLNPQPPVPSQKPKRNFACVFGNKLCMVLSISEDSNISKLFSLRTTEFICGACVYKRVTVFPLALIITFFQNDRSLLFTVSINGSSKIYNLSTPDFKSARLLQDICTTNLSMLYCICFADCLCKHDYFPLCIGGTSNRIIVWSFTVQTPENKVVLSDFGIQKVLQVF